MSDRVRRRLAWALFALPVALVPPAIAVVAATGSPWVQDVTAAPILVPAFSVVGLLVVLADTRNSVGWLLLTAGLAVGLNAMSSALVTWETTRAEAFSGASLNALLHEPVQIVAAGVLIPRVLLLFPDGRLPTRRWRLVAWAQLVVLAYLAVHVLLPGRVDGFERDYENPLGLGALSWVPGDALGTVGGACLIFGALGAIASLIVRFRRSAGVERLQLQWVAWGVGLIGATFVLHSVLALAGVEVLSSVLDFVLCLFPLSVGIAVLRYRLYDIDRLIAKTLSYATLTVLLGVAYGGLVLGGQAALSSVAGGSDFAVAGSTLVVAALFLPARSRVQRFVDRRFYRRRYDAQRTIDDFAARLRREIDIDSLRNELLVVVDDAMQPVRAGLWLRRPESR